MCCFLSMLDSLVSKCMYFLLWDVTCCVCLFVLRTAHDFPSLPASARPLLDKQLDWDNETERDLIEIAHHMLDWEEKLCPHLGLTVVDVHDIKEMYSGKPKLQRLKSGFGFGMLH